MFQKPIDMDNPMWTLGTINDYAYLMKHYEECTESGIESGRITFLSIRKGGVQLYSYSQGLDFDKLDMDGKKVYARLLGLFN